MSDNRESLIAKIRALLAKTINAGCTESEANAALAKAQAMMEVYAVSEADLGQARSEKAQVSQSPIDTHAVARSLGVAISRFTQTKVWASSGKITFCGLKVDVEFAQFLNQSLVAFVENELIDFIARTPHQRCEAKELINGFVLGCSRRISERLNVLSTHTCQQSTNGSALMVIQSRAIKDYMQEHGICLSKARVQSKPVNGAAVSAGSVAGDRASFGRPLDSRGSLLLGGKPSLDRFLS